jgi:hypothetical protein
MKALRRRWCGYITQKVAREAQRRGLKVRSLSMKRDDMCQVHATAEEFTALLADTRMEEEGPA